jgi:CheY-like chemotaxis protein
MNKILIVDDERLILNSLSSFLSNEHTEVKTAETGSDALHNIRSNFYNLCFLDIQLPDINGLEVMRRIKIVSPETKVVIMTANFITDEMKEEIQNTAYGFIGKPFELSQIKTISELSGYSDENITERRHINRTPYMQTINYNVNIFENTEGKILQLKGNIINISNNGIGIRTDYLLTPGYIIRFYDETNIKAGVVKWSMAVGNNSYCAGIEILDDNKFPWFH